MRSMHILCLSVTLVICRIGGVKSEAFSSTANLVQLVDGEQQILDRFETYVQGKFLNCLPQPFTQGFEIDLKLIPTDLVVM